jgi:hypothetical protein
MTEFVRPQGRRILVQSVLPRTPRPTMCRATAWATSQVPLTTIFASAEPDLVGSSDVGGQLVAALREPAWWTSTRATRAPA